MNRTMRRTMSRAMGRGGLSPSKASTSCKNSENRYKARAACKDSENGSAIVEFVLIATPLFIPALLFFLTMQHVAVNELQVENLARQSLRAFATASSPSEGHQRIQLLLRHYSDLSSGNSGIDSGEKFTYSISCGGEKCLKPGSIVKIDLYRAIQTPLDELRERKVIASATGKVDKWRE